MKEARVRPQLTPAVALLLLPLPMSCGGGDGPGTDGAEWAGTIDTLASGTVVVHNPAAGTLELDSAWSATLLTRIGSLEGGTPESFGNVSALAIDGLGRIWVADRIAKEIRVFGPGGVFVRAVGQAGGGPGEFEDVTGVSTGPKGRMWAMDPENNRISVFDTAGAFLTSYRRESGGYSMPCRCGFLDGRHYYDNVYTGEEFALLRWAPDMTSADTLPGPELDLDREPELFELTSTENGEVVGRIAASVPFVPGVVWRLGPSGHFWVTPQTPYRLYELSPNHDTLRVVEREFEPVAVTSEEVDTAVARLDWFTEQGGEVDPGRIPDVKPAIQTFFVDELGFLWVTPHQPLGANDAYDIFDPRGVYLGRFHLPLEVGGHPVVTADRMYAVHEDELGVEYVVVLALRRGGTPGTGGAKPLVESPGG